MTNDHTPSEPSRPDSSGVVADPDAPTTEFRLPSDGDLGAGGPSPDAGTNAARDSATTRPTDAPAGSGADSAESETSGAELGTASATAGSGTGAGFWRRRPVIIAGAVLGGLVLLYIIAFAVAGGSLARNATVAGVEVGGLSPAEAEQRLAERLPEIVDQPIDVTVDGTETTYSVVPSEAGLTVDYTATVAAIPGGSASPVSLLRALFGGGDVSPVPTVDRAALTAAAEAIADDADVEPVNGSVAFADGDVVVSEAEDGRAIDVAATADALQTEFFGADADAHALPLGPVSAEVTSTEPAISNAEVERAVAEFAEPAMSAPVTVTAGEHTFEITPQMLSEALSMPSTGVDRLEPELDPGKLAEAASDVLESVGQPGRDATVKIENGAPVVVPHEVGVGVSPTDLAEAVLPVLTASGDARSASVEHSEITPEFTTADAEALGVKEVISEFTTSFVPSSYRNTNIGLAASKIHNTLLKPGDTFSLNGLVGERTAANGFVRGGVISGGQLVEAYGGGVSQVATTTYHAAFQAGLEDVEHRPHSIYYSHYPVGQEATVSWGNFDMAFKNDTPYGVLVETIFRPSIPGSGSLTVRLWSTEHFKVETSVSERHSFTDPPRPTYSTAGDCFPNQPSRGFSITSYRKVWEPDGTLVKDEANPWTYRPSPEVICGPEPSDDDDDD